MDAPSGWGRSPRPVRLPRTAVLCTKARPTGRTTEEIAINAIASTTITLTDEQVAKLAPLLALVGVTLDGTVPADQTPDPGTGATGPNAAGRLVYLDGPSKGKFAPTLTDAERAEKAEAGAAYVAERKAKREARKAANTTTKGENVNTLLAEWCRERGIHPAGKAWDLVKDGNADVKALKAANVADFGDKAWFANFVAKHAA